MAAKKRRRYTKYSQEDTYRALHTHQAQLGVYIVADSAHGNRITIKTMEHGELQAVVLAKSSDWYRYSLNAMTWKHGLQAAVVGTHDLCLPVRIVAMDSLVWYKPYEIRFHIAPASDPLNDPFKKRRKTQYGHNVLLGTFICGRQDAIDRILTFKSERTRLRYEAEKRKLLKRRRGKPFKV